MFKRERRKKRVHRDLHLYKINCIKCGTLFVTYFPPGDRIYLDWYCNDCWDGVFEKWHG